MGVSRSGKNMQGNSSIYRIMRHRIILDFWGKKKKKKEGFLGTFGGPSPDPQISQMTGMMES